MATPLSADVAELADAQVSEACDGDIVEGQVLSSAPEELIRASQLEATDSPFLPLLAQALILKQK